MFTPFLVGCPKVVLSTLVLFQATQRGSFQGSSMAVELFAVHQMSPEFLCLVFFTVLFPLCHLILLATDHMPSFFSF